MVLHIYSGEREGVRVGLLPSPTCMRGQLLHGLCMGSCAVVLNGFK